MGALAGWVPHRWQRLGPRFALAGALDLLRALGGGFWHLALLQQQAPRVAKSARMGSRSEPLARSSQSQQVPPSSLCCALCAAPVAWLPGLGVQACSACGSQLFRAEPPVL